MKISNPDKNIKALSIKKAEDDAAASFMGHGSYIGANQIYKGIMKIN